MTEARKVQVHYWVERPDAVPVCSCGNDPCMAMYANGAHAPFTPCTSCGHSVVRHIKLGAATDLDHDWTDDESANPRDGGEA